MSVHDDAARFAAEADPVAARLLAQTPRTDLAFRGWLDPRTPAAPGGTGRVADLRAILDDPANPGMPWLLLIEMQARPDGKKLRATLDAVGNFASRASDGAAYRATSAIVQLTGKPAETEIDARLGEFGTHHRPLPWDIEDDDAGQAPSSELLDARAGGQRILDQRDPLQAPTRPLTPILPALQCFFPEIPPRSACLG